MILDSYSDEKYADFVKRLWADRGVMDFDLDLLPETGYVVDDIAAGWLYIDLKGKVGWIAWVIADKNANPRRRGLAVEAIVDTLQTLADQCGIKLLLASTENESLGRLYQRLGFTPGDSGKTDYFKGVN